MLGGKYKTEFIASQGFPDGLAVKNLPARQEMKETRVRSLSWKDPQGNGNPLQYSCLENSMDRGAGQATVHKSQRVGHYRMTEHITSQPWAWHTARTQ